MATQKYIVETDETGKIMGTPVPCKDDSCNVTQTVVEAAKPQPFFSNQIMYEVMGLLAFLVFFFGFIRFTREKTNRIIQRFGKFKKVMKPGIGFKFPLIDKIAGEVDLKIQQLIVKVETKTKDNVFVSIPVAVQYYVLENKVSEAFYKLQDPINQITSYVFDTVRSEVPKMILDEVFEKKEQIALAVKTELVKTMDDFGYGIVTALVTDIDPAASVKSAMNEIQVQTRLRAAREQEGEGNKILAIKNAEAEAESKRLQGVGIAAERKAIVSGLEESVEAMKDKLHVSAEEVMNILMLTQYFDTIKNAGANKVILIPHSPAGMVDLKTQIAEAIVVGKETQIKA